MTEEALVRYRTPLPGRVFTVVFTLVWCGFVGSFVVRAVRGDGGTAAVLAPAALLLLGLVLSLRSLRIDADLFAEELVVRNFWGTRRIARADVQDVRTGAAADRDDGRTIHVLTRDGATVRVQALGGAGPEPLTARRDELQAWRSGVFRRAGS